MAAFPALIPSGRTWTPGTYPHSPFAGISGRTNRVRNSNVMLGSQLRLSFLAISEAQMLGILAHYQGQGGGFQSFPLPADVWSGGDPAEFQLPGYGWIYKEPPAVEDLPCGGHNVSLTLETVPPEGTALAGLSLTIGYTLTPGVATGSAASSASGMAQSIIYTLSPGAASATASGTASGMSQTIAYSLAAGTASGDSVALLLHMDGANGSTTFTDSSTNTRTIYVNGSTQISTSQAMFGGASGYFPGGANRLTVADNPGFNPETAFTVEAWLRPTNWNTGYNVNYWISQANNLSDNSNRSWGVNIYDGTLNFYYTTNGVTDNQLSFAASDVKLNQWFHCAISIQGATVRAFVNGLLVGSGTLSAAIYNSTADLCIGTFGKYAENGYGGLSFSGYIDELRIAKSALYTSNFTPQTAAFPNP